MGQDIKKITQWQKDCTDRIVIRVKKDKRLPELIQQALDSGHGESRQAYIIAAINAALERDGIPPISDKEKAPSD